VTSERKEAILTEAMQLIIENGLSELTMSKVAKRMKFSEPAMYRHFQNKQDLVISMIQRISGCFEEVFRKFDQAEAPEVFLPKYFEAQLQYLEKVRGVTLLFLSESAFSSNTAIREELQKMFQNQTGRVAAYLKLAASRGQIRPEIDPAAAALVYMGTVQAFTTRFILSAQAVSVSESSRPALDIFLKGVIA
jgi:AcrR family transcriptional regulator